MIFFKWCKPLQPHYVSPHRRSKLKIASVLKLLFFLVVFTISSTAYAQEVNLTVKDASLESVFNEIKKQTGYGFFYEQNVIKNADKITLKIKNVPLKQALDLCLKNQPLDFEIVDRTIVITSKAKPKSEDLKNGIVNGIVTDQDNRALAGATITEILTKQSVQTDAKGQFSLRTNTLSGIINITYLGFQAKTVSYTSNQFLTISITEDPATLATIEINMGYYSVDQKLATGSVSSIKAAALEKQPISNPLEGLQGRVTGANISQNSGTPGANISIEIRGRNSIEASTAPLYLVDGIPFGNQTMTNNLSANPLLYGASGSSPLNTINPQDIETIDILKDADATAIYGSRGANGVVLITTKKGKSGKTRVELSARSGQSNLTRKLPMLNTTDYIALRKKAFALDNLSPKPADYDINGTWDQNRSTDWQKELLAGTAHYQQTNTSISGGNMQNSFLASGSYHRQGSTISEKLGYQRAGAHLAASHSNIENTFKISYSATYSYDKTNWLNENLVPQALPLAPNAPPLYDASNKLNWENGTWNNPLRNLERKYLSHNANLLASSQLSYSPIKDLEIRAAIGYNNWQLSDISTNPILAYSPTENRTPAQSFADQNQSNLISWSIEPQASYARNYSFGHLSLLAGLTLQRQHRVQTVLRGTGFASDALIENLRAAATVATRDYSDASYAYSGLYARANYNLKDRYVLNVTFRRDGSSRFGPGRKFASFGAIGGAWLFSKEKFFEELSFISFAKLRASYGSSGSDQIGDYEYLDSYQSSSGYLGQPALSPLRLFNPDFGWERNRKLEVGLDLAFLKDRINLSIVHYRNRSSNQLIDYPLPVTTGFTSLRNNLAATVQNSGWEVELSGRVLKKGRFQWNGNFNLSIPKNRLIDFPGLAGSSYATTFAIGHPLGIIKAYYLLGVDPQTGLYKFRDENGDGIINAVGDRQSILYRGQRAYGGVGNNFSYNSFSVDVLFQFVRQTAATFRAGYSNPPGTMFNQPQAYQGRYWEKPGDIADLQRPTTGGLAAATTANSQYGNSQASTSDASFIRLKNISLSHNNDKLIPGKALRLFAQGQNLWTMTNFFGLDPETASLSLPPLATFTLGFQLTL